MTVPNPRRILVANDQEWSARSIESILVAEGYQVERAFTGSQVLQQAAASPPQLIILDLQLPDIDGLEVCRRLRTMPEVGPATPIVITSASVTGRSRPIDVLEAGAWDFFGQPIDGVLLLLKIRTYLAAKDEYDRARAGASLEAETGIYTPGGLAVRAREAVAHARRRGQPIACVAFRPVVPELEDAIGRAQDLGRDIAAALRQAARSADAVGRGASLTFFVLAPGTDAGGAARLAERLVAWLSERVRFPGQDALRFQTGCSVAGNGSPEDESDGDGLLRTAARAAALATASA